MAQGLDTQQRFEAAALPAGGVDSSSVAGKWTYRSFISDPDLNTAPNDLLFGMGTMELTVRAPDNLTGTLGGTGWQLALSGTVIAGTPVSIRFTGEGIVGGEQWVYDYLGYVVPKWSNGVDQRPAIVGTIVRTVPHSNGAAKAGYVAQWIAVRQDVQSPKDAAARFRPAPFDATETFQAIEEKWAAAVETNDPAKIGEFLTDDFLFVGAGGVLQDRAQHLEDFQSGNLKVKMVRVHSVVAHVYEGYAVANALTSVTGTLGTRDISGDYRFMDTFRASQGKWLAVARQQTKVIAAPATRANVVPPGQSSPSEEFSRRAYLKEGLRQLQRDAAVRSQSLPHLTRATIAAGTPRLTGSPPKGSLSPIEVRSSMGRLEVTLDVAYATASIGRDTVHLRMYNDTLVGPVLRAKAGDTLYITLNNRLPLESPGPHGPNGHHEWNTTNLHFHGLHVAPQGPPMAVDQESDNVLLELKPSDPFDPARSQQKYQVHIPPDHVAGTFWYHAHKHGAVAAQVSSGMAGALIIERDDNFHNLDSVPEVGNAREEILVLQEVPYLINSNTAQGEIEPSPDNESLMFSPGQFASLRRYITVNGTKIPTITMAPGEIRRFRFVYTGQRESVRLRIEREPGDTGSGPAELSMYEIAVDGLPTGSRREIHSRQPDGSLLPPRDRTLEMFPGYRSDVLVQVPAATTGRFVLVDTEFDGADGTPRADTGADGSSEPVRQIARIVVSGTSPGMNLPGPTALAPHRLSDLSSADVTGTQFAFYGLDLTASSIKYLISRRDLSASADPISPALDKEYDPTDPRLLALEATEKWLVGARNNGAAITHPFHIHVNPFLITKVTSLVEPTSPGVPRDVTAREIGVPTWRDTLAMKHGYTYELLTKYRDYHGSYVDHCHILDHEDNGMMELVTIQEPTAAGPVAPRTTSILGAPRTPTAVAAKAAPLRGIPSVTFFVKSSLCSHCVAQLNAMGEALAGKKVNVAVVTASNADDALGFAKLPFRVIPDPNLTLFKAEGAFDGNARHATVVRDANGNLTLKRVDDAPFMNAAAVVAALDGPPARTGNTAPAFIIAVRGTDDPRDDYLTWSPTPCTIRMVNGVPGSPPVTVALTNDDPVVNPTAGELRFATTLSPNSTATLTSITLQLDQDGTPQNFYVAGFKPSTLTAASLANGGRDTKIVIHQGSETGARLGERAVMVRVRKALRDPADPQPKANDLELTELLKALRDLHFVDNRLEWYVRLHRLATAHSPNPPFSDPVPASWSDQAHRSSAFITWHRAFLLQFERELQVRYPHVALLYWVQGTQEQFFTESRYGTSPASGNVVNFSTASPLYNWALSLPADPGDGTTVMGRLRRRPLDHNDPDAPLSVSEVGERYRQWSDFLGISNRDRFSAFRSVEANPHNIGHQTVGPFGVWMYNCRESNADPVFYVFHCNHDYLWAKWQFTFDRFVNNGSDPKYYSPADEFTDASADKAIPLGHHLKDTMWPWDGTTNQVVEGQPGSNRPNVNGFGPFPQSTVKFLWPSAPAKPRPQDVIDYAGYLDRANDLGFCYDDVPFGAQATPPVLLLAAQPAQTEPLARAVIADRGTNADTRMMALRSLPSVGGGISPDSVKTLSTIVGDATEAPDLRAAALAKWSEHVPAEAFRSSLPLLRDANAPLSVRLAALHHATRQIHFSEVPHEETHRVFDELRSILTEDAPPPLKAAAVRSLAPRGDSAAKPVLLASLPPERGTAIPAEDAVALLRFFSDEKDRLRGLLSSHVDEVAATAIHALYDDAESLDTRKKLARDPQRSFIARQAAVQSLAHDASPDLTEFLASLAADESEELKLREEALASAAVRLRKIVKRLSDNDKRAWTTRLEKILAAEPSELGRLRRDAIEIVSTKP